MATHDELAADITRRADALAERLPSGDDTFMDARGRFDEEYRELLHAVGRLDSRFAFDREGRPAATDAIREALPALERDLFDAVIEDHACELAAVEEALYQLARAFGRHVDRRIR